MGIPGHLASVYKNPRFIEQPGTSPLAGPGGFLHLQGFYGLDRTYRLSPPA